MKMHITIVTSSSNNSGGSRQALYLAQGMAERGHETLFFVPERSTLPDLAPNLPFWRTFSSPARLRRDIEAAMPSPGSAQVVHAFHNAAVKRAAWWGLFWKKRAVVVAHRGVLFRPRNPLPYWSPGIDAFLVNSEACGRLLTGMGVASRRVFYVPNAVPDSRLVPAAAPGAIRATLCISPAAMAFLCIGGNKPYKGVRELLNAFALAFPNSSSSEKKPHLVVIGVDPEPWQQLARQTGVGERIHCLGRTEDVAAYLAAASVFVLPSLSESMPNTLLEAVRAGLPCIGAQVGAVPDILRNCGLLVPPGDVPALAQAMCRMAWDAPLRDSLTAATRKEARNYVPEKRLDRVEDIYTKLLHARGLIR